MFIYFLSYLQEIFNHKKYRDTRIIFPAFIGKNVSLGCNCFVGRFTHLINSSVGRYTYMCNNCEFNNCKIGSFCSISGNVKVILGSHPSSKWISTHPLFFSKNTFAGKGFIDENRFEEFKKTANGFSCEIGNDVWIGSNVNILQGLTIGDGAIIGANSLVTKDVPPYAIVGGNPARIIKMRFSDDDIKFLSEIKWWNWDIERIKAASLYFNDINELKKHL